MQARRYWLQPWLLALALAFLVADVACAAPTYFVFYEVASNTSNSADVDVYAQRIVTDGKVGWASGDKPLAVADTTAVESSPVACSDGDGGAIVAYTYQFAEGEHQGDTDVVAQRVDRAGELVWGGGKGPVAIGSSKSKEDCPAILSDGAGGAFVVYQWTNDKGDTDLLAQHVGADGKRLWNDGEPVSVAASDKPERKAVVLPDGQGGLLVVFEWEGDKGDTDVMAQRISREGKAMWNEGKRATDLAATDHAERNVTAVSDNAGGAIAVFEVEYLAGDHKGDMDVIAQRVSGEGKLLWNDGKPVDVATSEGLERNPCALADGSGGVIVACEYTPLKGENAGDQDIMAQRLDRDGKALWGDKGPVSVASSKHKEQAVRGVATGDGGAIWIFELALLTGENKGDVDVFAQRQGPDGTALWLKGDKSVVAATSKWLEQGVQAFPDGEGGLVACYTATGAEGKFKGDLDVEAIRLSSDGKLLWQKGEKAVDIAAGDALERAPCAVQVSD